MAHYSPNKPNFLKQLLNKGHNTNKYENHVTNDVQFNLLEYYASLAVYHPDTIFVFSPDGEVISQNSNYIYELIGFHPHKKTDFKSLVSKQTYDILSTAFTNTLLGKSEKHEINITTVSGQTLYLLLTFIPIKAGNQQTAGVYLIIDNITEHIMLRESLELSKEHLIHAQDVANIASWEYIIDEDRILYSDRFFELFGLEYKEDISMEKPFEYVHPDDYEVTREIVYKSAKKGTSYVTEFRINHGKTKELRYIKVQADAIWKNQKPYKLVGVVYDITVQKHLENKLTYTNEKLKLIFNHLNVGIWMREHVDGKIIFASNGLEDILKIPLANLYEDPDCWKEMILPAHRSNVFQQYESLKQGKKIELTYRLSSADGTTKWLYEQTIPWVDEDGNISNLFGIVADISAETEMQEKINYMAKYDSLTGLPNQQSLYEKLDTLCKENNSFAVLYLDIDRFNVINDSLGHQIGDHALKTIASRLIANLPKDGYVARIIGNDFVIILEDYSEKNAVFTFAEQIMKEIEKPLMINEYELYVTTSIGISFFPDDGQQKLTLLENSHAALYHAKKLGKNNYQLYSFTKDIPSYKKYVLEKDMRKALNKEEFEIFFQPQVDPHRGTILGAEALIRWKHEDWGMVSPGEFIPLAEENHLINELSDWVIQKVCAQLKDWKDKDYTIRPISINISPIRFLKKGLIDLVKQQLELYQIPGKYLIFEITERTVLQNDKLVLSTLRELRNLGVKIAIDDFGTGYSTFQYLKEFEVDIIKIDQSFIDNIHNDNKKETAIVSSIMHLAKGLDLSIVAEGVEEYEQLEFLKLKECEQIQGYLFSEPVPVEIFEKMMVTGFLKPQKNKVRNTVAQMERRSYYRFEFPHLLLGEMTIIEVKNRRVNLGTTEVLINNISIGGIKIYTSLKLPIHRDINYLFKFKLLGKLFEVEGKIVWKTEDFGDTYYYGVEFHLNQKEKDYLAEMINKMSTLHYLNKNIPDTEFIYEDSYLFFRKLGIR
ncbi:EAL domain-containing protein [Oceanobacillus sp. Castelsardo]|uniref:EAL domain-containing protein n=1 Tax=Oceanobacillus sp. Castelsardo TaxID=1851204 RepID=UPI000838FB67|nr:EAL domain-containing protein [Oceanobacillus sp. Castelsardo]